VAAFNPNSPALAGSGIYGLPHTADEARVVLLPVPWDATTSYRAGAAGGPAAILEASRQVDLCDVETGRPYEAGIAMLPIPGDVAAWNREARAAAEPILAAGGAPFAGEAAGALQASLDRVNALGERLNAHVGAHAAHWIDRGKLVGVVGGDHASPFGLIAALAERHPGLGILHVDAHADLRDAYEGFVWSHASIMFNVLERVAGVARLVQVGIRDLGDAERALIDGQPRRVATHFDAELCARRFEGETWSGQCARIVEGLPDNVYVSFDVDGLDPALCPHTGTPVPGGLSFAQATYLLGALARSGRRIVGFDLCEVAPGPGGDEWDANVGARLVYKLVGFALRSAG
jgi:agmatinase